MIAQQLAAFLNAVIDPVGGGLISGRDVDPDI
jgi:hypothetical protein